jgi:iron complex outermembrane receptor protein
MRDDRRRAQRIGTAVLACGLAVSCLTRAGSAADGEEPPTIVAQAANEQPADEPGAAPSGVEVLKVQGRGAAAIEPDVPASLTQFDAKTIEALGAQDIADLSRVTPNVNIVQPGTQATFFVRGVGLSDFSSNAAGAVTIFQDDVSLNAPAIQTGQLFDVEGIDVLRGPQGSGPFRNASAGAIRVRSRRPTGNYTAQLRSSIGQYNTKGDKGATNALIQDYEGALEMPVVPGWLSSRFAFRLRDAEPYRKNGCGWADPSERLLGKSQCGEAVTSRQTSTIPFGLPKRVNDEHNWAARGTLRFQPPDSDSEFFLNAHGSRLDQDSTLGQAIGTNARLGIDLLSGLQVPFAGTDVGNYSDSDASEEYNALCRDAPGGGFSCTNRLAQIQLAKKLARDRPLDKRPYRGDYDRVGQTTRDAWGGFASGEAPLFGDTKLFGLASYDGYERFQEQDSDFTPTKLFEVEQSDEAWQTYEELRLDGELQAEPVEWEIGGYYLHEDLDNDGTVFIGVIPTVPLNTRRRYSQGIDSTALWGQFDWDFADDFTLEGGVRWNWERKLFDFKKRGGNVFEAGESHAREKDIWQTPTGQIILTYHIDPEKSAYARYTRGFKAGHFNALASETGSERFTGTFRVPPADEEYNDAWETGLRGGWLDRRISLAGSFFYYRYENYQIFLFSDSAAVAEPPTLEIVNAKQAENFGVELEGALLPLQGWAPHLLSGLRLSANFSWLHGEYLNFTTFRKVREGTTESANIPLDYSGKRLQNSPEYKVSATAEWTFDLGRFGYLIPRYDVNWSDDVFFDPNEGRGSVNQADPTQPALIPYAIGQKAYFLHNVRLAYRTPSANVEVAGWIRNVEDQVYKNYAFDASQFAHLVINFPGEPRTIGVDISYTF